MIGVRSLFGHTVGKKLTNVGLLLHFGPVVFTSLTCLTFDLHCAYSVRYLQTVFLSSFISWQTLRSCSMLVLLSLC